MLNPYNKVTNDSFKQRFWQIFWFSLLLHFVISIFSEGFYHPDEHFQIVEFAQYKLGLTDISALPYEFEKQMRPWFQPFLTFLVFKFGNLINIHDPFGLATLLRTIHALFGMFVVTIFFQGIKESLRDNSVKLLMWISLNFLFFMPYFHNRPSSDALGAVFAMLAVALFLLRQNLFLVGLIWGLAFLSRYQTGVMSLFFFIWLVRYEKINFTKMFLYCFGILIAILIGVVIDHWGYGQWVFAPWNYFHFNIILDPFGKQLPGPWWDYFRTSLLTGLPWVNIVFIVSMIWFWIRYPRHYLTWITIPFLLVHIKMSHKELRFLFPMIIFVPVTMTYFYERFFYRKTLWRKFFLISNLVLLVYVVATPAKTVIEFYRFVTYERLSRFYHVGEEPFKMVGLHMSFYKPNWVETIELENIEKRAGIPEGEYLLFVKTGKEYFAMMEDKNCQVIYRNYPDWAIKLNYFKWVERSRIWSMFYCKID